MVGRPTVRGRHSPMGHCEGAQRPYRHGRKAGFAVTRDAQALVGLTQEMASAGFTRLAMTQKP